MSSYLEILKVIMLINYNLVIKIRKCNINASVIHWLYWVFRQQSYSGCLLYLLLLSF